MRYVVSKILFSISQFAFAIALVTFVTNKANAVAEAPQSFNLDGILYSDNSYTTPLLDASVVFNIQVLDPSKTCVLFEENHNVNTAVTGGRYNLSLGSGTRTGDDPGFSLVDVFQNAIAVNPTNAGCGGTYTPASGHVRYARVEITPSSTGIPDTVTPDLAIGSVPNALVCENVQGIPFTTLQTLTNGSDASALHNHDGRYALLSGSGSMTMGSQTTIEFGDYTTAQETTLTGGLAAGDAGKTWYNSTTGKLMYWDGTTAQEVGSGGGGAVASVFGRTGVVVATAGDYTASQVTNVANGNIVATDVQAAIDELDTEKLALAGGTMSGNIAMGTNGITGLADGVGAQDAATMNNISSAITSNNASYVAKAGDSMTGALTLATQNELRFADDAGGDYISFKAPSGMSSNYDYTWPGGYGSNGQVLTTDGAGGLTWQADDTGGGSGTLDQSYDQGGAGLGRTVLADSGAVLITGSNASDEAFEVTQSGNGGAVLFENTGTGASFRVNDEASDTSPFFIDADGNIGIGTATPNASALLDLTSTAKGFLPPRMDTSERTSIGSPAEGLIVFDTDEDDLYIYKSGAWAKFAETTEVTFRVHRNGTAITNNASALVDWSTEDFDVGSGFDLAADRFTPTSAGYYFISYNAVATSCSGSEVPRISIRKNGTNLSDTYGEGNTGTDQNVSMSVATVVYLNGSTDYIDAFAGDDGCTNISGEAGKTFLTAFLISGGTGGGGGGADHLGNHTATQNIILGSHYLSGDGGAEGLQVDAAGDATFSGDVTAATFTGDGSGLTNIGASALANDSIGVDKLDFASAEGIDVPQQASPPSSPTPGQTYFNTGDNKMYFWDGSGWVEAGGNGAAGTVGMVAAFPMATCPSGWLPADGSAVSRSTYANLFASVSTMYGPGDGSTTFDLPDYRGQFLRGADGGAGVDPDAASRTDRGDGTTGDNVGSKQSGEIQSHGHGVTDPGHSHTTAWGNSSSWNLGGGWVGPGMGSQATAAATTGISINATGGNETRPTNITVIYCISYSGGVTGGEFVADGTTPFTGNIRLNDNWLSNDGGNEGLRISDDGHIGIGTATPTTGTALDITGTGAAGSSIIIPRDSTANRPTVGVNGMMRYNSSTDKFEAYEAGAWTDMIGGGAGGATADADDDTKIQVEESADEDIVRIDTAGTERMTINATGAVNFTGDVTANSFTGDGSGLTNIGASAIAANSITVGQVDFASTEGITVPSQGTPPGSPVAGQTYFDTGDNKMYYYDGSGWVEAGGNGAAGTVGMVAAFPMATCPTGWLPADGTAVSRSTYSQLFAAVSTMYGPGDGSTTFDLPDYRGQFLRGADGGAGVDPDAASRTDRGDGTTGDNVGTKQGGEIQAHDHSVDPPSTSSNTTGNHTHGINGNALGTTGSAPTTNRGGSNPIHYSSATNAAGNHSHTVNIAAFNSASSGGNETRPTNIAVIYCISHAGGVTAGEFVADGSTPFTGNIRLNDNWLSNDGDNEGIRINNDGEVGIGTSNPYHKLHVFTDTEPTIARFEGDNANDYVGAVITHASAASTSNNVRLTLSLNTDSTSRTAGRVKAEFTNISDAARTSSLSFAAADNGNFDDRMTIAGSSVGIGTSTPDASALLDLTSTTKGFLPPRMTEAQRDAVAGGSPAAGLLVYNADDNELNIYNGTAWGAIGGGGSVGPNSITVAEIDFASTEGINVPTVGGGAPGSPTAGQTYYDTDDNTLYFWNGSEWVDAGDNGSDGTVGMVTAFPMATCPTGWIPADGSAVSRSTYSKLFTAVSTMYGPGDGSTTFNVPDYRGQFLRGTDGGAGSDPDAASRTDRGDGTTGDNVGTKQGGQIQSHGHGVTDPGHVHAGWHENNSIQIAGGAGAYNAFGTAHGRNVNTASNTTGVSIQATGGNETRPTNVNVIYCISYLGGVTAGEFVADGSTPFTGNIRLNDNYLSNDGDAEGIRISNDGAVGIGIAAPDASALLDLTSTSQGFLPPRMSGTQRDAISSPATGLMVYNTDSNKVNFYSGSAWSEIGAGTGIDADGDTMIQVEEGADDDTLRVDTAGAERMTIDATGAVNFTGTVTATAFVGDGSGLTNIGASAISANSITLDKVDFGSSSGGINIPSVAGASPSSPVDGQTYFDDDSNELFYWDGALWRSVGGNGAAGTVGMVASFPMASCPAGWLPADGSAVSRTTYSKLYAAVTTMYGVGDGSTTFNLPDYRGRFLRGTDGGAAVDPDRASRTDRGDGTTGDNVGTKQGGQIQSHGHGVNDPGHSHLGWHENNGANLQSGSSYWNAFGTSHGRNTWTAASATGVSIQATGGNETRPTNINVIYCISHAGGVTGGEFVADGTTPFTGNIRLNDNWLSNDGGSEGLRISDDGHIGIGTATPTTGAALDITGTGAAASSVIIPRDTTANRPTVGVNGMMRYNSTSNKFEAFENGAWADMIGGSAGVTTDADGDTMIQVEETADEDIIRIDTAGTERMTINASGATNFTGAVTATSFTGDGSGLTNIGAAAIADNSISVGDLDFASTDGINVPQVGSPPGTPTPGQTYFDTGDNKMYFWDGTSWRESGGNGAAGTVGMVASFPMASCPTGWLAADGSPVSRSTYSQLFVAVSTMYGAGDGSTTFNLPDYRGQFLRGVDGGAGTDPDAGSRTDRGDGTTGDTVGTKQSDGFASHLHNVDPPSTSTNTTGNHNHSVNTGGGGNFTAGSFSTTRGMAATSGNNGNHNHSVDIAAFDSASTGGNETRPTNVNVIYCISYAGGVSGGQFAADGTSPMTGNIRLNDNWLSNDGGNEGIRIDNSGNVGIGTSSPTNKLDVTQDTGSQIHFGSSTGGGYLVSADDGQGLLAGGMEWNGSAWVARHTYASYVAAQSGEIVFASDTGLTDGNTFTPTVHMTVKSTGRVGIGTTSPGVTLDVVGTVNTAIGSYGYLNGTGTTGSTSGSVFVSIRGQGRIVATEFNATSDRRIKENIRSISSSEALEFVRDSRPVHYKWTTGEKNENYGFIAQDLLRLGYSELVSATPVEGMKEEVDEDGLVSPEGLQLNVNYSQIVAIITQAVSDFYDEFIEFKNKIFGITDKHEREIANLKEENQELRDRNEKLEGYLCKKDPEAPFCQQ